MAWKIALFALETSVLSTVSSSVSPKKSYTCHIIIIYHRWKLKTNSEFRDQQWDWPGSASDGPAKCCAGKVYNPYHTYLCPSFYQSIFVVLERKPIRMIRIFSNLSQIIQYSPWITPFRPTQSIVFILWKKSYRYPILTVILPTSSIAITYWIIMIYLLNFISFC